MELNLFSFRFSSSFYFILAQQFGASKASRDSAGRNRRGKAQMDNNNYEIIHPLLSFYNTERAGKCFAMFRKGIV